MKKSLTLGHSDITLNRIGLGCMGMSDFYGPSDDVKSTKVLQQALEEGINFFDTSDMYGVGHNEELIGKALAGKWDRLSLATKFGVMRAKDGSWLGLNGRPDYVKQCCDASLKRLGVDRIDLYYLHRLDPQTPIEETVGAMKELVDAGKVGHLGLSEVSAANLKRAHAVHPISALQTEFSMWTREAMEEDHLFDICKDLGITFVAYSPLGRGFLTGKLNRESLDASDWRLQGGRFQEDAFRENWAFVDLVKAIAKEKNVTPAQVALAWILHLNPELVCIPGTRSIERVRENVASMNVEFTTDELETLHAKLPKHTVGTRYPEGSDPRDYQR